MKSFIQYDEFGNIIALVCTDTRPPFERQIRVDCDIDIQGKRVNLDTLRIEDNPNYLIES